MLNVLRVTVWNEAEGAYGPYEGGIHNAVAGFLQNEFSEVRTATLEMPEHGLTDEVLENTDVLVWWGHSKHHLVDDGIAYKVRQRIYNGMGFVALHSAHASKVFSGLMGTNSWQLRWRDVGELERVWTVDPSHPIAEGVPEYFEVPKSEMYGEFFNIPTPDEVVFISWYAGGEVFRSGCTFKRGKGKVFFFSPGHEDYPIYLQPQIQRVISNGVKWAAPVCNPPLEFDHQPVSPNEKYNN